MLQMQLGVRDRTRKLNYLCIALKDIGRLSNVLGRFNSVNQLVKLVSIYSGVVHHHGPTDKEKKEIKKRFYHSLNVIACLWVVLYLPANIERAANSIYLPYEKIGHCKFRLCLS